MLLSNFRIAETEGEQNKKERRRSFPASARQRHHKARTEFAPHDRHTAAARMAESILRIRHLRAMSGRLQRSLQFSVGMESLRRRVKSSSILAVPITTEVRGFAANETGRLVSV